MFHNATKIIQETPAFLSVFTCWANTGSGCVRADLDMWRPSVLKKFVFCIFHQGPVKFTFAQIMLSFCWM